MKNWIKKFFFSSKKESSNINADPELYSDEIISQELMPSEDKSLLEKEQDSSNTQRIKKMFAKYSGVPLMDKLKNTALSLVQRKE